MKYGKLLTLGLVIHVMLLLSIFDIYFKSPIISGIAPQINTVETPVARLVFISVDGLRYESLFNVDQDTGKPLAPYMQNVINFRGLHGVSQCHLPTESRPGHVAMLAGFYEDPSAVTRGWKKNPVDFDSLFNQSSCSYAWGSPDILNVFFEGLNHTCAHAESYNENEQQFAGNTLQLDNWVFDKVTRFLNNSNHIQHNRKSLFFLHLLGQDTSGHAHKPYSEKFNENLKNVDRLVKEIEILFEKKFPDEKTCYIFTSDHGMTNWGSHGAGDPTETQVPFIAWGAGISTPKSTSMQHNISQADITPLVAVLLGISIPVNSIGILPVEYLNMSEENIAKAMLLNAKQMTVQLQKMSHSIEKQSLWIFYNQFGKLSDEELDLMIMAVSNDISQTRYSEAITKCNVLISLSLEGLNYYQNYYQRLLLFCVTLSYLSWIVFLITLVINPIFIFDAPKSFSSNFIVSTIFTITIALLVVQKLPISFYLYCLLPECLCYLVYQRRNVLFGIFKQNFKIKSIIYCLLIIVGVEMLVMGFFYREMLCIPISCIVLWPVFSVKAPNKKLLFSWVFSGLMLAVCSLLPVIGKQPQVVLIGLSGFLLSLVSIVSVIFQDHKESMKLSVLRCVLIILATFNASYVHFHFKNFHQLENLNQIISWISLIISLFLLVAGDVMITVRLIHIYMSLCIPFILLTVNHEGFFIFALFLHLYSWLHLERRATKVESSFLSAKEVPLSFSDFRKAYFFLCYISIAFFGIGNIASLNSFDLAWVRAFLTVFSPFTMSSLVLFKTIIPFIAVICSLRAISVSLQLKTERLFIIVLIYCNIMGVNFLYMVTNKGSWLEIGTSISHYVIQQVTALFIVVLYVLGEKIMTFSYTNNFIINRLLRFSSNFTSENCENSFFKNKTHKS